jgi:hypothetical protein
VILYLALAGVGGSKHKLLKMPSVFCGLWNLFVFCKLSLFGLTVALILGKQLLMLLMETF